MRQNTFTKKSNKLLNNNESFLVKMRPYLHISVYVVAFLAYVYLNKDHTNVAYVNDELGYLNKALALSGAEVTGPTSWHVGYSALISLLLRIFTISNVWLSIVILNSFLFTISLVLLERLLVWLFPRSSSMSILGAILITACYPAWATMAGYAFPTPLFVFILIICLSVYKEALCRGGKMIYAVLGLLTGLLYWVHPVGITFCLSLGLMVMLSSLKDKRFSNIVACFLPMFAVLLTYVVIAHPYVDDLMSAKDSVTTDIPYGFFSENLDKISFINLLVRMPTLLAGEIFYLVLASFGLIGYFLNRSVIAVRSYRKLLAKDLFVLTILFSLVGSVVLGVVAFYLSTFNNDLRPDHIFYGRYMEMYMMPVLGMSFLLKKDVKGFSISLTMLLAASLVLYLGIDKIGINYNNFDQLHTPALWPMYITEVVSIPNWTMIGVLILVATFSSKKYISIVVVLLLSFIAVLGQQDWHEFRFQFALPSEGLLRFTEDSLSASGGDCVAFWASYAPQSQTDRIELYKFYLANYSPKKMSYEEWVDSDCSILLIPKINLPMQVEGIVSREEALGIIVVSKDAVDNDSTLSYTNFYSSTSKNNNDCALFLLCFDKSAKELLPFVGADAGLQGDVIVSKGAGLVVFGPYAPLESGDYILHINASNLQGITIEIISSSKVVAKELNLEEVQLPIHFTLEQAVVDLEIKLYSTENNSDFRFYGYRIEEDKHN